MFDGLDFSTVEGRDYVLAGANSVVFYYLVQFLLDGFYGSIPWGSSAEVSTAFGVALAAFAAVIVTEGLRPTGFRGGSDC